MIIKLFENYAFSGGTCPNPTDPILIHLRIKSTNQTIYSKMAEIFKSYDTEMLGKDYSFENSGTNLGSVPLLKFQNKIILIVERNINGNNAFLENKEFLEYAPTFSVSKWSGNNELNIASDVIIANSKILLSRFDENEWVKYVDLLIVDECHKINHGSEIGKIVNKIATSNKFGFTGTLPPDKLDYWSVLGKFGAVIFEKTSHELREENYLTDVEVKICHIEYKTKLKKVKTLNTTENYMNELEFIKNNSFRQDILRQICIKFNKNILIMVNHIEHGEKLQAYLTENIQGRDVFFIQGSVDIEDRENVKHTMENKDNIICIAMSSIFSTGVNIKNIHMIIFAAGGKALIRTVQSIGRGLRLHPTKTKLVIIDIADNLYYGMQHAEDRKEIYSKEKIKYKTYLFNEK